ncbi:peptidase S24/S26A/S26B/S26C [Yarrowia lipolytica]|jgi:inner membrane protease subunit 1|uniref:Peptidase S24/S26A/S26B/S26C n=1 Tax=Yarrowia lipolytica TaxID=4952 RepID=A0A1H6PW72_YARLL|nr:hypothetical protein YALI1_F34798g [Yarrowia lipolytica]KAB8284583.1 peptidase S24/S26A/S26B/S26C [Yarrowia lipolytica]KAE8174376.1 peptidase S24/S26A/S26B/S26C [Yarrowia lipolytica]KAJ8055168.1 peptidase S24/S26A/S26B/S26C [Yarrowia lipolytica]QNP99460.1 Mitochondrial inner membrane protease subunit 1 [Yarrowia lipolytica]
MFGIFSRIPVELRTAVSIAVRAGCAIHFFRMHIFESSLTYGPSMIPTLDEKGDFVNIDKLKSRGRGVQVGDVVVAIKPTTSDQRVCKRISGMPGDIILIDPERSDNEFIQVPKGHCWVTGDNLSMSLDSRTYRAMPLALVKGKIIAAHSFARGFRFLPNTLEDAAEDELITNTVTLVEDEPVEVATTSS